ncbi:Transmembrane 9 superfamily member 3 [Candida viswanathii]|uniref:Transmembrane 9 superfamily member n=1 Tax=Candida viswanathii TaxID=5486 RepID=A0A367YCN6_9ASCO|nr:Transmembrane 9 superfamily member 3 [Candida viswanathii]
MIHLITLFLVSLLVIASPAHAFDLGLSPTYYKHGDKVELLVNKVESDTTQLPFSYYSLSFVCPPMNGAKPVHTSLGELLKGERIWQSGYQLHFGVDQPCSRLCDLLATQNGIKRASQLIKDGYVNHWSIDGLPGATTFESTNHRKKYYAAGFPLGFVNPDDGVSYIYNHVMLVIRYHKEKGDSSKNTIVGFEVYPKSVINEECPGSSKNYQNYPLNPRYKENGELEDERTGIPYTYSVYWREDNTIDYDSRWELYYENESNGSHVHVHWISFVNSFILIFLASLVVMIVLIKVLKKDIQNNTNTTALPTTNDVDSNISSGWKNLINDVNHIPRGELFLSTLVAAGIQMFIAIIGVIVILMLNSIGTKNTFFNAHQGACFSISISFIIASGLISSYAGVLLHKYFRGDSLNQPYDRFATVALSLLFSAALPAGIFTVILVLNFFVWAKESSAALPFGTIVVLLSAFLLIQCPLGIIGGYYANNYTRVDFKTPPPSPMTEKSLYYQTARQPRKSSKFFAVLFNYLRTVCIYGIIPFGIVYVELLFIFNSVWLEKTTFYFMYGFLFITIIMLVIIIIESTIVAVYISLVVYNDPHWIWLSFQVGSSLGWFIYGYSIYYYINVLNVQDFVSGLLYFVYMALASVIIGVSCGAVGLLTGLIFIRKIYGAIKVD